MRLLDIYCGTDGGEAARTYESVGFDTILGINPSDQPSYPYEFLEADPRVFVYNSDMTIYDLVHIQTIDVRPLHVAKITRYLDFRGVHWTVQEGVYVRTSWLSGEAGHPWIFLADDQHMATWTAARKFYNYYIKESNSDTPKSNHT